MPTVFKASLDGSLSVRYFHVPIIGFYLGSARDYAQASLDAKDPTIRLRKTVCAITFSAMTLEAFINEVSEDVIPEQDRAAFDKGREPYKKPRGQSSVSFRYSRLVAIKHNVSPPGQLSAGIEELINVRNTLVHYKPTDTAGKYIMPPPAKTSTPDGAVMISFSFVERPLQVELPFLRKVSPEAAVSAYNTALRAIRYWHELCGDGQKLEQFHELSFNNASTAADAPDSAPP